MIKQGLIQKISTYSQEGKLIKIQFLLRGKKVQLLNANLETLCRTFESKIFLWCGYKVKVQKETIQVP